MSGNYRRPYNKYSQRPRYRPRYGNREFREEHEEEKLEKHEESQVEIPKTRDEGVQIDMFGGIPCRLIPMNPEDYPRLLELLNMPPRSS